jgi:hypothetical protein
VQAYLICNKPVVALTITLKHILQDLLLFPPTIQLPHISLCWLRELDHFEYTAIPIFGIARRSYSFYVPHLRAFIIHEQCLQINKAGTYCLPRISDRFDKTLMYLIRFLESLEALRPEELLASVELPCRSFMQLTHHVC